MEMVGVSHVCKTKNIILNEEAPLSMHLSQRLLRSSKILHNLHINIFAVDLQDNQ